MKIEWEQGWTLDMVEAEIIRQALEKNDWNRTRTAPQLGISLRTLRNKISGIGLPTFTPVTTEKPPKVKRSHPCKVTEAQALELLAKWNTGMFSLQLLADEYGVSKTTVMKRLRLLGADTSKAMAWVPVKCARCGAEKKKIRSVVRAYKVHYCSHECHMAAIKNGDYVQWRHGLRIARQVVSEVFDLKSEHVVHHIDKNNRNNDISNLMVFACKIDHGKWHRLGGEQSGVVPLFDGSARLERGPL